MCVLTVTEGLVYEAVVSEMPTKKVQVRKKQGPHYIEIGGAPVPSGSGQGDSRQRQSRLVDKG